MKKDKKGMGQMWWIIGMALLTIIFVLLFLNWSKGTGEKAFGSANNQIDQLGDWDQDGIADKQDDCPFRGTKGKVDASGCPKDGKKKT